MEKLLDRIVTVIFVIALIAIIYFVAQYVSQRMIGNETDDIEIEVDEDDFFVDSEDIDDTYNSDDEEYYNEDGIADKDVPEEYNDEIAGIMKDVTEEAAKKEASSEAAKPSNKPAKEESEAETEENESSSTTAAAENQARYMIVTGSFTSKSNAEVQMQTLKKEGYNPEIVNFNGSKMFTVIASRYNSKVSANAAIKQLKGKKIDCYIHTKRLK